MSARDEQADGARLLRSGDVAGAAGVNVQTLRYYERRGLLAQPDRNGSGHRQYPPHTVTLVRMIKNAQRLRLSLEEIEGVIAAGDAAGSIESIATRKVIELEAQIAELTAIRDALARWLA